MARKGEIDMYFVAGVSMDGVDHPATEGLAKAGLNKLSLTINKNNVQRKRQGTSNCSQTASRQPLS